MSDASSPETVPLPATPVGTPAPAPLPPAQVSLAEAVREIEQHVAGAGWDGPVRVFALVNARSAITADPALVSQLPPEVVAAAGADPHHLVSVEQEGLDAATDVESLLAGISWPPSVDGAAIVLERVILPPSAEAGVPEDPQEALAHLAQHPDREDVRLAVGVLRDGPGWCAVRTKSHDADTDVAFGPTLVPGLLDALSATFED
ncbi:PPA1309 family protein [Oerskovia flava]|uniref:PPA1309 family protein n=1 Tax=Oerskovia flava TaxID=2986422 RepID=UPI00223F5495|nr:PPA1309 family protein [Oerskovia sp. JB1-3-2]